ncbi:hypothetical protein ACOZ07_001517 [Cronobacter dublinensis]
MFKHILSAASCLIVLASIAQAADSTNLSVTGKMVNGSCTPFGLGKTAADINIGSFCLAVDKDNVTVDGVKSDLVEQSYQEGVDTWHTIAGGDLTNGVNSQWRYMTAAEASTLAITDNTNLDGSATLSLIYL